MKRTAWLAVAAMAATAWAVTAQGAGSGDLARLKGAWEVTSLTFGGKKIELPAKTKFTFDGEKVRFESGNEKKEGTIKLDENKKPKQFTISENGKVQMSGIYQLDGDTLKMAGGNPSKVPSGFDDDKAGLFTLKRIKK